MVQSKEERIVAILAGIVMTVLVMTSLQSRRAQPDYPMPLEHSHSHGTATDSTQAPKRAKTGEEHTTVTSAGGQLTQEDIDGVRYFVLFIGYAHSGHSIIGSMMDAHPNMVIAHEYSVMNKWLKNRERLSDKKTLFNELCSKSRSTIVPRGVYNDETKGYTLAITNLWQGCRFTDLKVIGDKRGGLFTDVILTKWKFKKFRQVFDEVKETVGVPIKLIHVVRNPFDMIATELVTPSTVGRQRWDNDSITTAIAVHNNEISLMRRRAKAIMAVEKGWGADMLEIHHADFIHDPKAELQRICDYLSLDCPQKYLETCYNKTFKTVSKSRYLVNWPSDVIAEGEAMMKEIPFFRRYSFDSE